MAAAEDDRLSNLPDDLLRHVLRFAPAKETASTAVLSRRWRSLWRTTGAVNLDTRSYGRDFDSHEARDAFFRGAEAALAAALGPVTRLTIHIEAAHHEPIIELLYWREDGSQHDMIAAVLASPAARRVEHLSVCVTDTPGTVLAYCCIDEYYGLSFGSLPSESLRTLQIINCTDLDSGDPPLGAGCGGGGGFPWLATMRLHACKVSLRSLQDMLDAAPRLAALSLERTLLIGAHSGPPAYVERYRLRCPAVTSLVLVGCQCPETIEGSVELDVPMLRYFRYHGLVHRFSLKQRPSDMTRADLHFTKKECENDRVRVFFWQFIQNFSDTKVLKLKLDHPIDRIAIVNKNDKLFSNLERLELDGYYSVTSGETTAAAVANLLHCCPVLRDLQLTLRKVSETNRKGAAYLDSLAERKFQSDFNESVNQFRRRRRRPMVSSLGGDDDESHPEVSDIPGLSGGSFNCLQSYLRRISLKFWMEHHDCFGTQLIKFFIENALVLEEMYIDDGCHKTYDHMNHKVERWVANSSKQSSSSSTARVAVLTHET